MSQRGFSIILLICIVALCPRVYASELTARTYLSASIAGVVEVVEWPSETVGFPGPLIPGQVSESDPIIIKVRSNTKWNLTLSTDNEKAVLSAYDTVARKYITNGDYINDTLQFRVNGLEWQELKGTPQVIAQNMPNTGEAGLETRIRFRVQPSFDDSLLGGTLEYRIGLQFTVSPNY
jgi:hypothetical protein